MYKLLQRIWFDEDGLEAIQVVMILGIAAVVLALLKLMWPQIRTWFQNALAVILGWTDPAG